MKMLTIDSLLVTIATALNKDWTVFQHRGLLRKTTATLHATKRELDRKNSRIIELETMVKHVEQTLYDQRKIGVELVNEVKQLQSSDASLRATVDALQKSIEDRKQRYQELLDMFNQRGDEIEELRATVIALAKRLAE